MLIKTFKKLSKNDANIAGGKGASLGEMTQAGIPVPSGFVILADAFEKFLVATDLNVEIESILEKVDHQKIHTIENASEKIQAWILQARMPKSIKEEIEKEFRKLGVKFVAVRSSATAEDGAEAAWAGQLESFLNTTEKTLLENVQKCWASLFTPRAIFYRFEKKLHKQKISVAVVVQKMIQSEKSGIAFSVHPVTEDPNQLIIEAGFGLGEAIVSGSVTPDSYVVEKNSKNIIDINVSRQKEGLYQKPKGGSVWKTLGKKGETQVLSEKEIKELSELIIKIENHYGFPCDIEWAQENGKFYIVQSRPITTLVRMRQEYRKVMTRSQNIIDSECWDLGERVMLPKKFKDLLFFDPLFIHEPEKAVAIYYNFTDPKQNFQSLIDFLEKNVAWLKKERAIFNENCRRIREIIKSNSNDHEELHKSIQDIWPMIAVANALGSTKYFKVSKKLLAILIKIREESDDVLHPAINHLTRTVSSLLHDETHVDYIFYSEFAENKFPSKAILQKRKKGWLFHKGQMVHDIKKYLQKNNIWLINPSKKDEDGVMGNVACQGYAKGKAKIIFKLSDLKKIKKGDVLVAPMTTPEMIPALKKAVAIVTDEGGITCHAAIVSREMKIPCIIGTINATQLLKDGDLVAVDANNGVVRILKMAK